MSSCEAVVVVVVAAAVAVVVAVVGSLLPAIEAIRVLTTLFERFH